MRTDRYLSKEKIAGSFGPASNWSRREFLGGILRLSTLVGLGLSPRPMTAMNTESSESMEALRQLAAEAMEKELLAVTDKIHVPRSGDKHDFMSLGPYWWPNPREADGLPFIRRDGEVNPMVLEYDGPAIRSLAVRMPRLLLGGRLLNSPAVRRHAASQLRRWFLDENTRMNPHLRFAQGIPGICDGRGIGLIDSSGFCGLLWELRRMKDFPEWTATDSAAFRQWLEEFLHWFLTSPAGRKEELEPNNHGSWYDAQVCSYAAFLGGHETIARQIEKTEARILQQVTPEGEMPREMARTLPLHYAVFNYTAFIHSALQAEKIGINLLDPARPAGRRLLKAGEWIAGLALRKEAVGLKGLVAFDWNIAIWPLARLEEVAGPGPWSAALAQLGRYAWQRDLYIHMRTDESLAT
jgi:hypothetical protein